MPISPKTATRLTALAAFLFGFAFIAFFYIGFPVDFTADHISNIRDTSAFSYGELFRFILNPTTPAWFYPPGDGSMAYLRPLQFFLMKLYFNAFDYALPPFHLTAAIGNGILGLVLFTFIYQWTRNRLLAFLAIVFYSSLPSNFFTMSSTFSMDFQHYIGLTTLSALFLFGQLTLKKTKTSARFILLVAGWVIMTWLAIKLKSSEKVIPFICGAFVVLRFQFILRKIGRTKTVLIFGVIASLMILVVPLQSFDAWIGKDAKTVSLTPSSEKDKAALSFHWKNLIQRAFYVPGGEVPFTTLFRDSVPRSFSENFGFFMSWFFWLSLLFAPFMLPRFKNTAALSEEADSRESYVHYFYLFFIWFSSAVAGFSNGLSVFDTRFLNFAYVPSMLLLFMLIHLVSQNFFTAQNRRWFFVVIAFLILFSALTNFALLGRLLTHFGGMQSTVVRAETAVYRDFFKAEPSSTSLYEKHPELESRVNFIDWYDHGPEWFEAAETKLKKEGVLYFYTREGEAPRLKQLGEAGYEINALGSYALLDSEAGIFRFLRSVSKIKNALRKKAKLAPMILVYKVTPEKYNGTHFNAPN